jgi:hypothetical protein
MITKVGIQNLRGIRAGELGGLTPVSVLVGPNNAGKSTCLEAIAMASLGTDVRAVVELVRRRGGSAFGALHHVASGEAPKCSVGVEGPNLAASCRFGLEDNYTTGSYQTALQEGLQPPLLCAELTSNGTPVRIFVDSAGRCSDLFGMQVARPFRARLVDVGAVRGPRALEDAYTDIDRGGRLKYVLDALRASMPGLVDLRILKEEEEFVLHTFRSDGTRVPTYLAGRAELSSARGPTMWPPSGTSRRASMAP